MLEVKELSIHDKHGKELVSSLSFSVQSGDKIAIIGEEGNGKSTLIKCIVDKNLIKNYTSITGDVIKKEVKIGYLEQNLNDAWNEVLLDEFFLKETPEEEIAIEKYASLYQLKRIFKTLKLSEKSLDENRKITSFSGGEKIKLQLAKLLLEEPNLLVLDEPTNDLDMITLQWLEEFLKVLEIPVIFVSHDEILLEHIANKIIHLERVDHKQKSRVTVAKMGYKEYIDTRLHLLERQEKIAEKEKEEFQKKQERFQRMFESVNHQLNTVSRQNPSKGRLLKKKMKSVKALQRRMDKVELTKKTEVEEEIVAKFHNEDTIHCKKVILNYHVSPLEVDKKILSKSIDIEVIGKEKVVIIGDNGCGKTTLLKQIVNELQKREDITVGYMPQNYDELLERKSSVTSYLKKEYTKEEEMLFRTYLGSMKFTEEEVLGDIQNLSAGQKAKLCLVKLIMEKSNVLVLDEPTRNLSPLTSPVVRMLLKNYTGAIISVSHDRKYIEDVCDTIYYLDKDGLKKVESNEKIKHYNIE